MQNLLVRTKITKITSISNNIGIFQVRFAGPEEKKWNKGKKTRCHEDECKVLEKIQRLVTDKIMIGHDLSLDLKYICINPDWLLRNLDLAAAVVFKKLGLTKKGQFFKLSFKGSSFVQRG